MTKMYPLEYRQQVEAAGAQQDFAPSLIYAVIHTESHFNANAISPANAKGLMQLTEDAFDWVQFRLGEDDAAYADIFDPEVNIRHGSAMLSLLIDELGDERSAVAAYHAGLTQVREWLDDPDYSDDGKWLDTIPAPNTREYTDRVLNARNIYKNLYD